MIVDIFSRRLKWVPTCHARTMSLTVCTQSNLPLNFSIVHVLPPGKWLPFEQSYILKVQGNLQINDDDASCKVTFLPMPDNCPGNRLCGVCKNPETGFFRNVIWQVLPLLDVLSLQVSEYFESRKSNRLEENIGELWRNFKVVNSRPVVKYPGNCMSKDGGKSASDEDLSSSSGESWSDFNHTVLKHQKNREIDFDSGSETSEFHPTVLKRQTKYDIDVDASSEISSDLDPRHEMKTSDHPTYCTTDALSNKSWNVNDSCETLSLLNSVHSTNTLCRPEPILECRSTNTKEESIDELCVSASLFDPVLETSKFLQSIEKGNQTIENDSDQLRSNTSTLSSVITVNTSGRLVNNGDDTGKRCSGYMKRNYFGVNHRRPRGKGIRYVKGRMKTLEKEMDCERKTIDVSSSSDSDDSTDTDSELKVSASDSIKCLGDDLIRKQDSLPTTSPIKNKQDGSSVCIGSEASSEASQMFDNLYKHPSLIKDLWSDTKESTLNEKNNTQECEVSGQESDFEEKICSWPLFDATYNNEENGSNKNEFPANHKKYCPGSSLIAEIERCVKVSLRVTKSPQKPEHGKCQERSPDQIKYALLMNLKEIYSKLDIIHFNDSSKKTKILEPEQKIKIARLLKSFIKMYYAKHSTDVEKANSKFAEEKQSDLKKDGRWKEVILKPRLINANKLVQCLLNLTDTLDITLDIRHRIVGQLQTLKSNSIADYTIDDYIEGYPPVCFICHKVTKENSYYIERRYGILDKCDHLFCFPCIRNVALIQAHKRGIHYNYGPVVCPTCNVESNYLAASKVRYETSANKVGFLKTFQTNMESFLDEGRKYLDVY